MDAHGANDSGPAPPAPSDTKMRPTGMRGFTIIWAGQLVSLLGTGMTQFTITIWAWQTTGIATTLALVGFFTAVPQILTSPLAGAIVSLVSYGIREIRDLESLIPDHNTASRQADPA